MIKAIEIASYGSIKGTIKVPLGNITLLQGPNATGKTVICRAIATALTTDGVFLVQSCGRVASKVAIEFVHQTLGVIKLEREFRLTQNNHESEILFAQNDVRVNGTLRPDLSILSGLVNVVYLSSYDDPYSTISRYLREDRFFQIAARFLGYFDLSSDAATNAVIEILRRINYRQDRAFRKIEIRDKRIYFQHWDKETLFQYESSGSGDKALLLSDFFLEAATFVGQYRHVLLILDDFPTLLTSERFFERYRQLSSPNIQVIMTTVRYGLEETLGVDKIIELDSGSNGISIRNIRSINCPILTTIERKIESYKSGSENDFLEEFVLPVLRALGFMQVRRVSYHGAGEHGFDIPLFHKQVFAGRVAYFGAQIKTGNVGSKSSGVGTITELIDQLKKMLTVRTIDPATQLRTSVDYALAIISGSLTSDAQRLFDDAFEGDRRVLLWDTQRFASVLYDEGVWPAILASLDQNSSKSKKDHSKKSNTI